LLSGIEIIFTILLVVVPAYAANGMALLFGGGKPLDGGKKFVDGKRILGDGKTVRGTISGIIAGAVLSIIVAFLYVFAVADSGFILGYICLGFSSGIGAVIGDLTGSFIKRRIGLPPGFPAPLIDQFDFILMALLFFYLTDSLLGLVELDLLVILVVLVVTPFAHVIGNLIVYRTGRKSHPW